MSDGLWTYAWWPLLKQRLVDAQIEDCRVGYLADMSYRQARETTRAFKSFCPCVAVAGALMAAEDRGYKSGYKTGHNHGWNAAMTKAHWASWDVS